MPSFKHRFYRIEDFIALVRNGQDRSAGYDPEFDYAVYWKDGEGPIYAGTQIYISDPVQGDDDDRDIYPQEVMNLRLSFLYLCEHFQSVVDLAVEQKPAASDTEIIACLNHFREHDDFLDLSRVSSAGCHTLLV